MVGYSGNEELEDEQAIEDWRYWVKQGYEL